jgi:hypothetical protein
MRSKYPILMSNRIRHILFNSAEGCKGIVPKRGCSQRSTLNSPPASRITEMRILCMVAG